MMRLCWVSEQAQRTPDDTVAQTATGLRASWYPNNNASRSGFDCFGEGVLVANDSGDRHGVASRYWKVVFSVQEIMARTVGRV
jgi:hypothetical protein